MDAVTLSHDRTSGNVVDLNAYRAKKRLGVNASDNSSYELSRLLGHVCVQHGLDPSVFHGMSLRDAYDLHDELHEEGSNLTEHEHRDGRI